MEQVAQLADLVAKALEAIQLILTQHQDKINVLQERLNFWAGWEVLLSLWVAGLTWKVRSLLLKKE